MKLLKTDLKTGKAVEVDSYDVFDDACENNFGDLSDWDINCFDDFVVAFQLDPELENLTENELNRLEVTRPEMGWQWTRFLVRFLRENVMEMNTTREVNEVSGTSNN